MIVGLLCLIFVSQFIYFKIFRVFYTFYSMTKGGQVFEFWRVILLKIKNEGFGTIFLMMPFIICLFCRKKFKRVGWIRSKKKLVRVMVGSYLLAIISLNLGSKISYSPYDLFFKHHYPVVAAEKLGLLTTLSLDARNYLMGQSTHLIAEEQEVTIVASESNQVEDEISHPLEEENQVKEKQVLNINFEQLLKEDTSETLKQMNTYFSNLEPTSKNSYTGLYEGYNLVQITAESFSPYAIDKELTPTLYQLVNEGFNFTNFYTPLWELSTSDGEYAIMMGQIPKSGIWSMKESSNNYEPFALGNQLRKMGYTTMAFHNHDYNFYDRHLSQPNLGYDYQAKGKGLVMTETWPESDNEMMELTVPRYINKEPFHAYYMTVSGHMQYEFRLNDMAEKNKAFVEALPASEEIKGYLASQIELDHAVANLIEQLRRAGVLERTLITITPDHYPYALNDEQMNELAGKELEQDFELYKSSLILWTPNMTPTVIDKPCSSLDILPTLSNLLGIPYDSRLLVGNDIFSDAEPLVILYSHNFITEKGKYNALTKEFLVNQGMEVDKDYVNKIIKKVEEKFYYSGKILDEDYYQHIVSAIE